MPEPRRYLVIIDGQGETGDDYAVLTFWDETPEGALNQAIAPNMGYGKDRDGSAFVVAEFKVAAFSINDTTTRTAKRVNLNA